MNMNRLLSSHPCLLNWSYMKILILGIGLTFASYMIYFSLLPFSQFYEAHSNESKAEKNPIINDYSNWRSQIYEIIGDIRIHGKSSTIWVATDGKEVTHSWTVKPHPRRYDGLAMSSVTEINITMIDADLLPKCKQSFHVPAMIFSAGGYYSHAYHGIADIIVPLYFTSHEFNGSVMFLMLDSKSWWFSRYKLIFQRLSNYDTIDLGNKNEVQCFSRAIIGFDADHNEFRVGPMHFTNQTMADFTRFIRNTYSLERHKIEKHHNRHHLLIISRKKSRVLLNQDEVAETCERIGFEVEMREIEGDFHFIARYINSFDVIVAVHGAALTNMIFLPENALAIQIIPYGMRELAEVHYKLPGIDMNLRHLDYEITWEESSLSSKYSRQDQVYIDPAGIRELGWNNFSSIYHNQNVTVNINRFEKILVKGFSLLNS